MVEWQCQNEVSVHRTAKEFANDRKYVHEWCQCYSTLKGQTRGVLGKCHRLHCGQPLSVDLDHRVSEGREKRRQIGVESASIGLTSYVSPPMLSTSDKVAKWGAYMQDATVVACTWPLPECD